MGYNVHNDNSVIQEIRLFYKAAQIRLEGKKIKIPKII